jgi:hypothetical protein
MKELFVNTLFSADDRTIIHCWVSLRPPDLSDLQMQLSLFLSKDRPL